MAGSARSDAVGHGIGATRFRHQLFAGIAAFGLLLFLVVLGAASALADGSAAQTIAPTSEDLTRTIEREGPQSIATQPTDPDAAADMPHSDLSRGEALELLQGVFEAELQSPAGIFDELQVEKFLAPNVVVIAGDEPPSAATEAQEFEVPPSEEEEAEPLAPVTEKEELRAKSPAADEDEESGSPGFDAGEGVGQIEGARLLDSSLPLRTESSSGAQEAVDLSLEHDEGALQATAPLVEVNIPDELGEGIELPGPGVTIELAGAPGERSPSTVDQSVGFFPNVATDSDLGVALTPTGVETLTQLRSADSPHSQTFNLDFPAGATLQAGEDGGAAVMQGEETLVGIPAPTAIDATGAEVPVNLEVSGDSLTVSVSPDESAEFPILADPLFQIYEWANSKWWQAGICNNSFEFQSINYCNTHEEWSSEGGGFGGMSLDNKFLGSSSQVPHETAGLFIRSSGTVANGTRASWNYTVPRFFTDQEKYGVRPISYISHMTLSKLLWQALSSHPSPYLFAGIWDAVKGESVSYYSHEGLTQHGLNDMSWQYQFPNPNGDTNAKIGYVAVNATETQPNSNADVYVGSASVELADKDVPGFGSLSGPSQWVNQTALPIVFTVSDSGLGVYSLTAATSTDSNQPSWKTSYGCIGVGDAACPRTWVSTEAGHPALKYEPGLMPQGIDYLNLVAEDPIGNKSATASVQVKVDHTAPEVGLSGTMTEQAKLGTKRPTYALKVNATDGTTESPQSGVAKASVEVDNKVVVKSEPGCSTKNCALPLEWALESINYSSGQHTVKVSTTDAVGLTTTKTLMIELQPSPPSLALSGTMTEQGTLGTSRPRYKLKLNASAEAGVEGPPAAPTFSSSFGSVGTGNGQLAHPGDVALDAKGSLWVVDENNNRIEEFNEKGEFIAKFGSSGSGNGQFSRPTSLAIDAKGNIWVTDAGNNRIEEFNEKGEFVKASGASGAGNGQFSGPEGIAIDAKGNLWVSDTYNARLQKFNEKGEFLKVIGTKGSATGQLIEPTGIDVGPGGNVWVADWANNRVEVYNEAGEYVRQFGSEGTGNGQFRRPDALAIDTKGNVWVGDQNNNRVQEFNQSGEYVAQFGSAGSGSGQFSFGYPMGIAADPRGSLWVTDTGNNRVQKWLIPGYAPSYSSSFGSSGTAGAQFSHPAGIAVSKGNLWVVDENNKRVEKFSEAGEYLSSFGSSGSGNGQFSRPTSVAIDAKGNLWVTDAGNSRIEEFNEKGEFIKAVGAYGSGNGQFNGAEGIAIDAKGNIWVGDTYNGRLQEFNEKGEFIKAVSSKGSGAGQLGEPTGLDIAPDGSVWVADWQNNRVAVFTEAGTFVRQFGSEGTGNGQFKRPDVIDVDTNGNVWVGDQNNNRIQEFNQNGEYITQFGSAGTGQGQFSFGYPMGIASDTKGNIWIADTGNNRVQRWSQSNWRSEIITAITVDGKLVNLGQASCLTEKCSIVREWTLDSSTYTPGKHTVVAQGIDGLGNTASKSLSIEVQRDATKPTLQAGGELVEAPEGWVEQESYGLNASAGDAGYGVTSVAFRIDGQQVASTSQACPDGGCQETLSKSIDMSAYSGGAHAAELIATDGAGNPTTQHWTINVDPEGHITAGEAEDTLEAADATSESTVVAPTDQVLEPEQIEGGDNPGLKQSGSEIVSTGVPDTTTMTTDPEGGFTIHSPQATTTITPIVSENSSAISIAEGVAGVAANTGDEVDSIIRPEYNGVQTFQAIRSATSPETYSWKVHLTNEQTLHYINSSQAAVVYNDGTTAFLITAENAHDATGALVPTSLKVNGDVLTLKVEFHSGTFVYPIVSGQGWEGGYRVPVIVEGPEDEAEIKQREQEERERAEREALEGGEGPPPPAPQPPLTQAQAAWLVKAAVERNSDIEAPPYPTGGGATASTTRHFTVHEQHVCHVDHCAIWKVWIAGGSEAEHPHFIRGFNWSEWVNGTAVHCGWHSDSVYAATGLSITEEGCSFAGSWKVWKGEGKHLTIWTRHAITALVVTPEVQFTETKHLALLVWVWPNGFQQKVVRDYDPGIAEN